MIEIFFNNENPHHKINIRYAIKVLGKAAHSNALGVIPKIKKIPDSPIKFSSVVKVISGGGEIIP